MLTRQVTDLAGVRLRSIARRGLAALVRIEVSKGSGAVAIARNGLVVDMIDYKSGQR